MKRPAFASTSWSIVVGVRDVSIFIGWMTMGGISRCLPMSAGAITPWYCRVSGSTRIGSGRTPPPNIERLMMRIAPAAYRRYLMAILENESDEQA
ncbi:MAG: hypothetical protein QOJ59_2231 [Thermomicrobiales bacterium]|nr:hypothetical protein [Thermomicrobiales bacterium]